MIYDIKRIKARREAAFNRWHVQRLVNEERRKKQWVFLMGWDNAYHRAQFGMGPRGCKDAPKNT